MTPRLVYLDTHDYSKFADAVFGRGYAELLPIYEELCKLADEGHYQFCFSQVIVSELLQVAPESLDIAKRKAQVVERLCGAKALPNPFWLFKQELNSALTRRRGHGAMQSHEPHQVVLAGRWLEQELGENAGGLLNVFGGVPFIIRPLVKFFIRRMSDQKLRAAISVHPMFQFLQAAQLDGVMIDWLKQRRDGANAMRIIGLALAYPTKLVWEPKLAATFINLNSAVRQFGDRTMEMFETFRSEIDAHYEKVRVPPPRSVVEGHVPTFATGLWTNVSRRLLPNEWPAERDYVLSSEFEQDVAELRFTQSFADIMIKVFAEAASVAKVSRRFKKGDGGDLLHSLYMPYCRVMRADGGFAEIARAVGAKYGCTVVGKLEELPTVLRAMQAADSKIG